MRRRHSRRPHPGARACTGGGTVHVLLTVAFLGALGGVLSAQPFAPGKEPSPANEGTPVDGRTDAGRPAEGHETEAETIAKCLKDLQAGDVEARRRAVMILGKYRNPLAMRGVIHSLRDPDADVRRSALVSASEWPMLPPGASDEVLRLIRDDNVHVRRLASSMLPDLVGGRPIRIPNGEGGVTILQAARGRADQGPDRALLATVLNQGLMDADVTVRRNILDVAPHVSGALERGALETCLQADDREIRVLAVRAYGRLQGEELVRAEALAGLVGDPDPKVRRELARALGGLGRVGVEPLEVLMKDRDPGVRLHAVRELVQLQHPDGPKLLRETILDDALPADERRDLVRYARLYREEAQPLLEELTDVRSSMLRAEALNSLARLPEYSTKAGFFIPFLDDESADVRREAGQVLARMASVSRREPGSDAAFGADALSQLFDSDYSDVRELAVRLALYLPAEQRQDLLVEACLDADVAVRSEALRRLAMLGTPEARDIVIRSLDDPNDEIVIAAIQGLAARPNEESLNALRKFFENSTDPAVREVAGSAIERLKQLLARRKGPRARPQNAEGGAGGAAEKPDGKTPVPPRWPMRRD